MGRYHGPRLWLLIMTIKSFHEIALLSHFSNLWPKARLSCSSSALLHRLPQSDAPPVARSVLLFLLAFGTCFTHLWSPGSSPCCHPSLPWRTYDIFLLLSSVTSKQPVSLVINTPLPCFSFWCPFQLRDLTGMSGRQDWSLTGYWPKDPSLKPSVPHP